MAIIGLDGRPIEETVAEQERRRAEAEEKKSQQTRRQQTEQQKQAQNRLEREKTEKAQAKYRAEQNLARKNLIQKLPGLAGRGLLGVGRLALGPYGLLAGGAYYGAKALGYDPFGQDEVQPAPTVTAAPVSVQEQQEPSVRFSQVVSPTTSATSKEVLNAALLRAGLSLLQGGTAREALTSAATVSEGRTKFKTGAEALAEGQKNLGQTATIYVSQNKDGTYSYSGKTDSTADALAQMFGGQQVQAVPKGKITKEQRDALAVIIRQQQPNATEQDIADTLSDKGYIYP